jgi:putative Mg2+ transporter-C (MgtC) family protein
MDNFAHLSGSFTGIEFVYSGRILAAALLGMVLGWERSMAGKHAGMRTYAMVSLGAAMFVALGILSSLEFSMFAGISPLQIASSVVVGIGFIGSGLAIFRDHVELTTAAGVWVAAAVGMACGFGFFILGVMGTILSILIFTFFSRIERKLRLRYGVEAK